MSNSNQKRIMIELNQCSTDSPPGTTVRLVEESNLNNWEVIMDGPEGSPYSGGHFKINVVLPTEFPFKPPQINFATKIWHPNITNDGKGSMCLGILKPDTWKPPNRIKEVLRLVHNVLQSPEPDDAVEPQIAEEYKNENHKYIKNAKDWTKQYASGK